MHTYQVERSETLLMRRVRPSEARNPPTPHPQVERSETATEGRPLLPPPTTQVERSETATEGRPPSSTAL